MRKKNVKIEFFNNHIKILRNVNRITEHICQLEITEYA